MSILLYIVKKIISLCLSVFDLLLLIRVILYLLPDIRENNFTTFVYSVTETVIAPVRSILYRFEFVRSCPIDLAFLAVALLTNILQTLFIV